MGLIFASESMDSQLLQADIVDDWPIRQHFWAVHFCLPKEHSLLLQRPPSACPLAIRL